VLKRVALMVTFLPGFGDVSGVVQIADVQSSKALTVDTQRAFVLTLESEPDVSYARGHLRSLDDGIEFPIQSNAALLDALTQYVQNAVDK
jgi:hypothetical protein